MIIIFKLILDPFLVLYRVINKYINKKIIVDIDLRNYVEHILEETGCQLEGIAAEVLTAQTEISRVI